MGSQFTNAPSAISQKRTTLEAPALRNFVERIPIVPPSEFGEELERLGYKGQEHQRAMLSLMAYRHVRRLKQIHIEGIPRDKLPPKQNMLILGPTGCGKTYLVELLFGKLLGVPTLITDSTCLTESGYVGDNVKSLLVQLIMKANQVISIAKCGVICLDEFDKLAGASTNARFSGAGTSKDVSGYGVQRELLTMIGGSDLRLPNDSGAAGTQIATYDIPFVACGAFSGLEDIKSQQGKRIGFDQPADAPTEEQRLPEAALFQRYGFIPELIGRFTSVLQFPPLNRGTLKTILTDNILPQFQHEFQNEGISLNVTDAALEHIAIQAEVRQTGARGLHTELVAILEQSAFSLFMQNRQASLNVTLKNNRLTASVAGTRKRTIIKPAAVSA